MSQFDNTPASRANATATQVDDVQLPTSTSTSHPGSTEPTTTQSPSQTASQPQPDPSLGATSAADTLNPPPHPQVHRSQPSTSSEIPLSTTVMPSTGGEPNASFGDEEPSSSEALAAGGDPTSTEREGPGPVLAITLLMTTGSRHPLRIGRGYLRKRDIAAADDDVYTLSVYTLKEIIWRDWKDEWDSRPSSPGSIRLIHFGRLLDDKAALKDCRFNAEAPNVVHMTVRPQEIVDEEDAKAAKKGLNHDGEGGPRTPSCRCVIL